MAHPYEVKTRLTAEEFVAFRAVAEDKGISQSSFIRMLVKEAIAKHCAVQTAQSEVTNRPMNGDTAIYPAWSWKLGDR